ncbi:hypothetical protein JCM31826_15500 [Thermaurantimonas aggregans]|uniref:FHA domain-containing protein n=1 Tax=Thermaurantimonas aggregans TaxID=2173829 RepID=A0A401XM48_9FLAO|nr:FHA domain-containing protein [Thermaurantimonas aggregans]MCX8148080.1 FHA domain-containing protein [Thermaurantimonas aggregans]GCD78068.1 hypothetical protein JCM31826_15500 [Thermaurantimonas aggregans]
MERATQNMTGAAKFRQSIGAGFSALSGSTNYFSLEFLTSDDFHKAGSREDVIVNYIEIGRDASCGIRISDKYPTVSRKHAAIQKEGSQYVLIHLSKSNPTLLNGRPVQNRWYLQNGDTIQLSLEGPKMTFLIPKNNKANSISLTRRLSLFGKQALRPYKTALAVMSVLLLLTLSGGGYYIWQDSLKDKQFQQELADAVKRATELEQKSKQQSDSLMAALGYSQQEIKDLRNKVARIPKTPSTVTPPPAQPSKTNTEEAQELIKNVINDVLFMKTTMSLKTGTNTIELMSGSCTCFLTNENKIVTAKHCVTPTYLLVDFDDIEHIFLNKEEILANILLYEKKALDIRYEIFSPDGKRFTFTYNDVKGTGNKQEKIIVDISKPSDSRQQQIYEFLAKIFGANPNDPSFKLPLLVDDMNDGDWAYFEVNQSGNIEIDRELSKSLKYMTPLYVFGYPAGYGANISKSSFKPIYGEAVSTIDGLDDNTGYIFAASMGTTQGNSGGPIFTMKDGKIKAVGIVSGKFRNTISVYTPVSQIPK